MRTKDIVALLTTAIGFLLAAGLTESLRLWSFLGNSTVPWFCASLATALLLVTLTAGLSGCSPGTIPFSRLLTVWIGSSLAIGIGMFVDGLSYGVPDDWLASLGEWFAFTVLLAVLFWMPRSNAPSSTEQTHQGDA